MLKITVGISKLGRYQADTILSQLYASEALRGAEKADVKRASKMDGRSERRDAEEYSEHSLSIALEVEDEDQANDVIGDVLSALRVCGPMEVKIKTTIEQLHVFGADGTSSIESVTLSSGGREVTLRPLDFMLGDPREAAA